ncbi:hypothetical protein GYMLUDRAFT_74425 [Collybiopsis luxurians FD-317 M1]|uniref:Major facilitator superfamily (MFS) profile domain-containing protein n=1 Tax=Collybiopsis luxurians FD-317 M1 TaxID=944289 RepID=A0A0D0BVI0_9AGAR|nr:hypothetical protein GYMLUDRAFT_74425 [Collybiopsis luxurians FD-317 M1]
MSENVPETPMDEKLSPLPSLSLEHVEDGKASLDASIVSEAELKRIQRKIDWHIMPWICVTYMFMRLNVNGIGNIAIVNTEQKHDIKTELHLDPSQWAWVISCFYYTYMFIEPVSTLMMKKTTPSIWISRIMVSWGIVACCGAAVQNYGGLITIRTLLGAMEGGYFPCILYFLSFWFQPREITLRICFMIACSTFSGIISGFISYGVAFADGRLAGWRWLFIIEGIPPIILGILTVFVLPDYPETVKFLTDEEKRVVTERLVDGAPTKTSKTWDTKQALGLFKDPTFWTFHGVWVTNSLGNPTPSFVLPTVIFQLGFTNSNISNVLTIPSSVAIFFTLVVCAYMAHKNKWNPFTVSFTLQITSLVCCVILMTVQQPIVRYIFILVARSCSNTVVNLLWPSRVEALKGTTAVGLGIAISNLVNQLDGLVGPRIFSTIYGPTYHVSFSVCAGLLSAGIIFIAVTAALVGRPVFGIRWGARMSK